MKKRLFVREEVWQAIKLHYAEYPEPFTVDNILDTCHFLDIPIPATTLYNIMAELCDKGALRVVDHTPPRTYEILPQQLTLPNFDIVIDN